MPKFAQQLTDVRKARNMTQEQLANALNISRSRISRWENGNAVPDIDAVRQISQVLQYDFFSEKDLAPQTPVEVEAPTENETENAAVEETPDAPVASPKKKYAIFAGIGAAVVILAIALVLALGKKPNAGGPEKFSLAWYQQTVSPKEKHAHVVVLPRENPTYAVRFEEFPEGVGWFYEFSLEERQGVDFTVSQVTLTMFDNDGFGTNQIYSASQVMEIFGNNKIASDMPMFWTGGFPLQDVTGVGIGD